MERGSCTLSCLNESEVIEEESIRSKRQWRGEASKLGFLHVVNVAKSRSTSMAIILEGSEFADHYNSQIQKARERARPIMKVDKRWRDCISVNKISSSSNRAYTI